MRRWSDYSERLSRRAVRLLRPCGLVLLSQGAGNGFDGCSRLDRRRAGNVRDQRFPVFRWNLEMWVGFNEWLFFHHVALLARTIVPPDLKTGYLKVRAFAGRI